MVLKFYGHNSFSQVETFERLKRKVPGQRGEWCISNADLIQEAIKLGFDVQVIRLNYMNTNEMMATIRHCIDVLKTPLIATQRSAALSHFGHSRLITGYEEAAESVAPLVLVHDPSARARHGFPPGGANRKWKADDFARMWRPNASVQGGEAICVRKQTSS